MLVILTDDEAGNLHFYPMINPKLVSYSEEKTYLEGGEGCLSVDREVKGLVHRAKRVTVDTYLYNDGKYKVDPTYVAEDLMQAVDRILKSKKRGRWNGRF